MNITQIRKVHATSEGCSEPSAPVQGNLQGRQVTNCTENINSLVKNSLEKNRIQSNREVFAVATAAFFLTAALVAGIFLSAVVSVGFVPIVVLSGIILLVGAGVQVDKMLTENKQNGQYPQFSTRDEEEKIAFLADQNFIQFAEEYEIPLNTHSLEGAIGLYKKRKNDLEKIRQLDQKIPEDPAAECEKIDQAFQRDLARLKKGFSYTDSPFLQRVYVRNPHLSQ